MVYYQDSVKIVAMVSWGECSLQYSLTMAWSELNFGIMNFGLLLAQGFGNKILIYLIILLSLERLKASPWSDEPFRNVMHPRWKGGIGQPEASSLHPLFGTFVSN